MRSIDKRFFTALSFVMLQICCAVSQRPKDNIKIVCSAALLDYQYEQRKQEYIKGLSTIQSYGYQPYVIEACVIEKGKKRPTFLDDYVFPERLFYSSVHNSALKNRGVNEAVTMLEGFKYFAFNDEDMIIKVTARYVLKTDFFITYVEEHPECDAFVQFAPNGYVITGCFAMRYKYFKNMLETLDLESLEKDFRCLEADVGEYVRQMKRNGAKIQNMPRMDLWTRWALDDRIVLY
jgi:hypothetical protein